MPRIASSKCELLGVLRTRTPDPALVESQNLTYNLRLKAEILTIVENQLREDDPPETRQTLERLLAQGYLPERAKEMIGSVVIEQIWTILHDKTEFDRARFVRGLEGLG